jgi:DsbC/DsbD-like thiol-disulfide interchange protein
LDVDTYRYFQRLWLTVELGIDSGLDVYGRPISAGYILLSITVAPMPGVIIDEPLWPISRPFRVDGVEEEFWVYEGKLTVSLPLIFSEEGDDQTVQITIPYQACSATPCFFPSTIRLELPLRVGDHIERPRSR